MRWTIALKSCLAVFATGVLLGLVGCGTSPQQKTSAWQVEQGKRVGNGLACSALAAFDV